VALIQDEGVSIMSLSGIAHLVFVKERTGDELYGISWSHDPADPKLAFRVVRKGAGEGESFSALVVYSDTDETWFYASPRVEWFMEPSVQDYTWLRVIWEDNNSGLYAPIPVANVPRKEVMIFHSYE
jgi:hypothetical protein